MSVTGDEIREALDRLGSEPNEIAQALENKGCKAERTGSITDAFRRCPLAVYLTREFPNYQASVAGGSALLMDKVYKVKVSRAELSTAQKNFVYCYDRDDYPQLIPGKDST